MPAAEILGVGECSGREYGGGGGGRAAVNSLFHCVISPSLVGLNSINFEALLNENGFGKFTFVGIGMPAVCPAENCVARSVECKDPLGA